ncbi:class I SAM-dependent methyltransferase [Patescibacteria group bacterium]|jgi:SAM-dependent methyltransferase|nr:class I SAM-dependent methyltransferase [Patescibacteria group bacterium]
MERERLLALFSETPSRKSGDVFDFLTPDEHERARMAVASDRENVLKNFFKKWPRFYERLSLIVSPIIFTGLTARAFVKRAAMEEAILNIGSGPTNLGPNCVNVDLYPFPNVHALAQADRLPFKDGCFDAVVCDQMLEHVADPFGVSRELVRVLKPGGLVYAGVPFIFPLHPSPKDYARWSAEGLGTLFPGCAVLESGVSIGPTSALLTVMADWLALVFSFGIPPLRTGLRYFFMLVLFPFKYLDILIARIPGAEVIAAAVYVVAKKS